MKARYIVISVLAFLSLICVAAEKADKGLPISQYPNNGFPNSNALFIMARPGVTNENISFGQLAFRITNGLSAAMGSGASTTYVNNVATIVSNGVITFVTNYVNTVSNTLFSLSSSNGSNLVVVLGGTNIFVTKTSTNGTNFYAVNNSAPPGFAALEVQTNSVRLGLVTNQNWTYGVTGSVSGATAILGVDDSLSLSNLSNNLSTTITVTSNFLATSSIDVKTNQTMLILQGTPNAGSQWYVGTNGTPVTNDTRSGFEVNIPRRSIRMGELADGLHPSNLGGQATNYWNDTNLGPCTVAMGSNVTARAAFSSIGGGAVNLILTNSKHSVISGGYNNIIDTNLPTSTIGGGGFNQIYGRPTVADGATISGGTNNIINGASVRGSTIGGGGDNSIESSFGTISGGFGNGIEDTASAANYAFIGGGLNNHVGENGGTDGSTYGVVCGGNNNRARGLASFIGGGDNNNLLANDDDYSSIVGGQNNDIGIAAGEFESKYAFIGGGLNNDIANDCTHSVITGGADNSMSGNNTNCFIGGGRFNNFTSNVKFASILGGERNSVTANYGNSIGTSNSVTGARATALGVGVTASIANSVVAGEFISYNTPDVISGAGSGSTNYLLAVTSPKMLLGSSNVHIYGVSGTIAGKTHNWSVNITNLSGDTWGIGFSSGTNRWKFQSWMYGTNAPSVLTNNTLLRLNGESEGTNTLVTYEYFSPAL